MDISLAPQSVTRDPRVTKRVVPIGPFSFAEVTTFNRGA